MLLEPKLGLKLLCECPLPSLCSIPFNLCNIAGQEIQHVSTVTRLAPIARLMDVRLNTHTTADIMNGTLYLLQVSDDQFYCTALKSLVALETIHCSFQELHPLLTCISHIPTQLALTVELANQLSSGNTT